MATRKSNALANRTPDDSPNLEGDDSKGGSMTTGASSQIQPSNVMDIRDALAAGIGAKHKAKIVHAGGALVPMFPDKPENGDARFADYLGSELITEEKSGKKDGGFCLLTFAVRDPQTGDFQFKAQMSLTTTMQDYFQCKTVKDGKKEVEVAQRNPEKTPPLLITYAGSYAPKSNGFSGAKRWVIEEVRGVPRLPAGS